MQAAALLLRGSATRVTGFAEWLHARLGAWAAAERGRFTLWLPMFMGAGIVVYHALRFEPPAWPIAIILPGAVIAARIARRLPAARAHANRAGPGHGHPEGKPDAPLRVVFPGAQRGYGARHRAP